MSGLRESLTANVKLNVLLIEHDQSLADSFRNEMAPFNVTVHKADELEDVFICVEETKLDAAFIDVEHPALDPLHIITAVRRSSSNSTIPIIILIPLDKMDILEKASKAGATHFLPKPVIWEQMRGLMESVQRQLINERRKYRRAKAEIPVLCSFDGEKLNATSIDLSGSGMLLKVEENFPLGKQIIVAFPFGKNYSVSFLLQAKVVRILEGKKGGRLFAIKFYNVPKPRTQKLLMWVDLFLYFDEKTAEKERKV